MGCFDSVYAKCPNCSNLIEFQSKGGACAMRKLDISKVPTEIAVDLDNQDYPLYSSDPQECDKCAQKWYIKIKPNQPLYVEMELLKKEDLKPFEERDL